MGTECKKKTRRKERCRVKEKKDLVPSPRPTKDTFPTGMKENGEQRWGTGHSFPQALRFSNPGGTLYNTHTHTHSRGPKNLAAAGTGYLEFYRKA